MTFETTHTLTIMEAHTTVEALISYALRPDSTDERIRNVIGALRAIDYPESANALERLQGDFVSLSSAARDRIESYSTKAHG